VTNREAVIEILAQHFLGATADEWVRHIHPQGVPIGVINSIAQALDEPQVKARNMLVNIPHPLKANFLTVGSPIKLSGTPVEYLRPAPMLGEHTDEVLKRQLGLDDERLAELKARGVIEQLGER
jgi:crotonobetainyl-CoA:carnitine CoA-transferase CaiB-like acyl-CoA transferase